MIEINENSVICFEYNFIRLEYVRSQRHLCITPHITVSFDKPKHVCLLLTLNNHRIVNNHRFHRSACCVFCL